jgi:hypothetical protein
VRFLWPHRSLVSRQAVFIFGQVRTDATLQACACSDQIGASCRVKRTSSSVKSGPTQHSRRAFTRAESWPLCRVKRASSSVKSGPTQRSRRAFTQAESWPLCRIKRTFPSVTTISDRLGSCAPNAIRAQAVTYPAEGHLEDYAPLKGVA